MVFLALITKDLHYIKQASISIRIVSILTRVIWELGMTKRFDDIVQKIGRWFANILIGIGGGNNCFVIYNRSLKR